MFIKNSFKFPVKDYMTYDVETLCMNSTLNDALRLFEKRKANILPVVDQSEQIIGALTLSTLLKTLQQKVSIDECVMPYIIENVITIYESDNLYNVRKILQKEQVGYAIVISQTNRVIGTLDSKNIILAFQSKSDSLTNSIETLIQYMQTGVIAIDRNGIIVVVNEAAEAMCNIVGKNCFGNHYTNILPELNETYKTAITSNENPPIYRITIGEKKLLVTAKSLSSESQFWGGIFLIQDLTNYEQIANELEVTKNLERTLKTVVNSAYDGLILIDKNGKIEMVNESAAELVSKEKNPLKNQPIKDIFPELKLDEAFTLNEEEEKIEAIVVGKRRCLVKKIPIFRKKQAVGAIAKIIYKDLNKWKHVVKRLDTLEKEVSYYRGELSKLSGKSFDLDDILTKNEEMNRLKRLARQSSRGFSNVLLLGESGTGKELFARGIHTASNRSGNYIKINCAAIPIELWESEFFGYDDGAFTGARRGGKPGKFELANNGTIFLDEIGDMPLSMQVKLLRVLQEREFERVGGTKTIHVDVKVVAATNKDLMQMVANNEFREDLYYRLNVIPINIPPLRKRLEDIPLLATSITKKFCHMMGFIQVSIDYKAMMLLTSYHWPGNVRELENTIERAMNCITNNIIEVEHLPEHIQKIQTSKYNTGTISFLSEDEDQSIENEIVESYKNNLLNAEKEAIKSALKQTNGNRTAAAKLLGISRSHFYKKLSKLEN
ncbi:sigma 54-interacting transcriptional regulator [Bacillus sp. JJ722]|uniref:sigma 54-interacting transcriptional regulator n=1 Tax=Bacillus sp. JJ722 TaxID=3122973 RepID=UPI00300013E2